jgi:glycosyltransferase involved in cell wall biosynthesis
MSKFQDFNSFDEITLVKGGLKGGGAERVLAHLINAWIRNGRKVNFISMRSSVQDVYSISDEVNRIVLGGAGESSNKFIAFIKNIHYIWKLRKTLQRIQSPVVLSFITRSNIYSIIACLGLDKHVVISERNDTTRQLLRRPWPWLRKKLYKYADIVTANSMISLKSMEQYVPKDKLKFVPNPVVMPAKSDIATPENSTMILNVARLSSHKAQFLIIKALANIAHQHRKWSLQILGEGKEHEKLVHIAEQNNIRDKVKLPGFVHNLTEYYKSAAIFVLPSYYEGMPNALLEAMSYGLPCVISDSLQGGLELIEEGKTGLVFRSGDTDDLTNKLKYLIEKPELRIRLGKAAHNYVKEFSIEKVIGIWDKVLKIN